MIELEIRCALAQGAYRVQDFSEKIPGPNTGLELGDVFTLPHHYEVFSERCFNKPICSEFIFVKAQNGRMKRLYPSQFLRKVPSYNQDGILQEIVYANGSAVELFKMYSTITEGMDALKGKTIMVTNVRKVLTKNPNGIMISKTVYTFDLM